MTSQTKYYIEVSDIVALRFECRTCRAVLTLPLVADIGKSVLRCPKCKNGWTQMEHASHEPLIEEFVRQVDTLAHIVPGLGFSFSLELSSDPAAFARDD